MKKNCIKCKKEFDAIKDFYKYCSKCQSERILKTDMGKREIPANQNDDLHDLLLNSYVDSNGNPLKEIYLEVPDKLANIFVKEELSIKQLRDFLKKIANARIKAFSKKGIESARPLLYECENDLKYQFLRRKVINKGFFDFMVHHLNLAKENVNNLDYFYKHLDSILCSYPEKK